jgi:hypothetical protein
MTIAFTSCDLGLHGSHQNPKSGGVMYCLKKLFLLLPLLAIALFIAPQTARADSYALNIDACSGGCGTGTLATVDVTQFAVNQVKLQVTFTTPTSMFVKTGAGDDMAFAFNIAGNPTIALVGSITSGTPTAVLALISTNVGTPMTNSNFGDFGYAVWCPACGNGSAGGFLGPLTFVLQATGLTPASFATPSTGSAALGNQFFAVDMLGATTGNTGVVAGSARVPVPEPSSLITVGFSVLLLGFGIRKSLAKE